MYVSVHADSALDCMPMRNALLFLSTRLTIREPKLIPTRREPKLIFLFEHSRINLVKVSFERTDPVGLAGDAKIKPSNSFLDRSGICPELL